MSSYALTTWLGRGKAAWHTTVVVVVAFTDVIFIIMVEVKVEGMWVDDEVDLYISPSSSSLALPTFFPRLPPPAPFFFPPPSPPPGTGRTIIPFPNNGFSMSFPFFSWGTTTWLEDEEVKKEKEREHGEDVQNERSGFVGGRRWIPWMRLLDDNGGIYARNDCRPRQNDLHHSQCKPFFRALRGEVAFRVDGRDEWFTALVQEVA